MKKKLLAILLSSVLLLSSCGNSGGTDSDKDAEISRLQEQLNALGADTGSSDEKAAETTTAAAVTAAVTTAATTTAATTVAPASKSDMWELIPEIDETPASYLSYYYRDDIGTNGGIMVDGVKQKGITKIRIPERIDGKPVIGVDFLEDEVKTLILPETVEFAYINKGLIEYMNFTANLVLNYKTNSYYKSTRGMDLSTARKYGVYTAHPDSYSEVVKGIYLSDDITFYIGNYYYDMDYIDDLGDWTNCDFMYRGKIYNKDHLSDLFVDYPYLGYQLSDDGKVIEKIYGAVGTLIVPEGVTEIKAYNNVQKIVYNSTLTTLMHCGSLAGDVVLPDSITTLGEGAFEGNDNITSFTTGCGLKIIPVNCFKNCSNLTQVIIGDSVEQIEAYGGEPFSYCSSLKYVYLGDNIKNPYGSIFRSCNNLEYVSVSNPDLINLIPSDVMYELRNPGEASLLFPEMQGRISNLTYASYPGEQLGKTVAEVEKALGITLNYNDLDYTAHTEDNKITVNLYNKEGKDKDIITSISINEGEFLKGLKTGMTYSEVRSALGNDVSDKIPYGWGPGYYAEYYGLKDANVTIGFDSFNAIDPNDENSNPVFSIFAELKNKNKLSYSGQWTVNTINGMSLSEYASKNNGYEDQFFENITINDHFIERNSMMDYHYEKITASSDNGFDTDASGHWTYDAVSETITHKNGSDTYTFKKGVYVYSPMG